MSSSDVPKCLYNTNCDGEQFVRVVTAANKSFKNFPRYHDSSFSAEALDIINRSKTLDEMKCNISTEYFKKNKAERIAANRIYHPSRLPTAFVQLILLVLCFFLSIAVTIYDQYGAYFSSEKFSFTKCCLFRYFI